VSFADPRDFRPTEPTAWDFATVLGILILIVYLLKDRLFQ